MQRHHLHIVRRRSLASAMIALIFPMMVQAQTPVTACSPNLSDALTTTTIDIDSRTIPLHRYFHAVPGPGGEIAIAWSESGGGDYATRAWLTRVDSAGKRLAPDVEIKGLMVKGLVRTPAGYAVLVTRSGDAVKLLQLDPLGKQIWETGVISGCPNIYKEPGCTASWFFGEDALVWQARHNRFAVQTAVQQNMGAQGTHQSDILSFFSADGRKLSGGWNFAYGCAHSMDQTLADNGQALVSSCFADARPYEGTSAILLGEDGTAPFDYRTATMRATLITRAYNTLSPDGRYLGSKEVLGELRPTSNGFWLPFVSEDGRRSADAGLARLRVEKGAITLERIVWLTADEEDDVEVHLIPFGTGWLAAYGNSVEGATWPRLRSHLVELDSEGRILRRGDVGLLAVDGASREIKSFFNYADGDAGWVMWDRNPTTYRSYLQLMRVSRCTPPSVAFTGLTSGQQLSGSVTVNATAADDVQIDRVEFLLDGALLGTVRTAPYRWTFNTAAYSKGSHVLRAKAVDTAANSSTIEMPVAFSAPSAPPGRLDVNGDGMLTPQDALIIINHLNSIGPSSAVGYERLDVNGDKAISPKDVLMVINALNGK